MIWLDEWAFIKYNQKMYESMRPAVSTASDIAKRNGTPYGILVTTTPSTLDVAHGSFFYQQMNGAAQFSEKLYDYFLNSDEEGKIKLEKFIESNSDNNFIYIEFSYAELGKTEEWLKKQERDLGNLEAVKREILLEWSHSNDDSLFNEEKMTELSSYVKNEIYNTIEINIDNKIFNIYMLKYMDNIYEKNWIIGLDIAGGLGRDNTAFTVVDPGTLEPVMIFKNNVINGPTLRKLIKHLIEFYLPNAIIIPERNYAGLAIIDDMIHEDGLEKHIYYTTEKRQAEKQISVGGSVINELPRTHTRKVTKQTRRYGHNTTKKTRDIMFNEILSMIVEEKPYLINNKFLFQEVKSLQMVKGRIDHAEGAHDDLLVSYLIVLYIYYYEKDIKKFLKVKYGSNFTNEDLQNMEKELEEKRREITQINNISNMVNKGVTSNNIALPRKFNPEEIPKANTHQKMLGLFKR